ncbi:MAG TPA: energy transducer TonB [Terriglobales bacterium]|nr:energy transducer TonB [Terriglobales bacterium]
MSSPVLIEQLDCAIQILLSNPDAAIATVDSSVVELLAVAAELRTLPSPGFRARLRDELTRGSVVSEIAVGRKSCPDRTSQIKNQQSSCAEILPTLFGPSYEAYAVRRSNFAISVGVHVLALTLILSSGLWLSRRQTQQQLKTLSLDTNEYVSITPDIVRTLHGGGGGGDRGKMAAPQGHLPKLAMQQITPPEVVVRNDHPKLGIEPTGVMPPSVHLADNHLPNLGNPVSSVIGPLSNGIGASAGIGAGRGAGIGSGAGGGFGPGIGGGYGGGVFRVGGGVSAPSPIYKPEPEYSPEARQAKLQGTVILSLIVGADGRTRGIRIARSLGMGLDERAIEAVRQWRFDPAKKDGAAVPVAVEVEVSFRLF